MMMTSAVRLPTFLALRRLARADAYAHRARYSPPGPLVVLQKAPYTAMAASMAATAAAAVGGWNPALYMRFGDERTQPAVDLGTPPRPAFLSNSAWL